MLQKLAVSPAVLARRLTAQDVDDFRSFLSRVEQELLAHRIIRENAYTNWFQSGQATDAELRHFVKQFSVFSNMFLVAQLLKVINAPTLEQMHANRETLVNELVGTPAPVSIVGSAEGSMHHHKAAHYEWLLGIGKLLGLGYNDLGKRRHGRPTTLHFCDELNRTYGSEDPMIAEGASFAVENWAASGFWQDLEAGLQRLKQGRMPPAFFSWHNRAEGQQSGHIMDRLEEAYFNPHFDAEKFFHGGHESLDAVATFWDGLENDRMEGTCT